MEYYFHLTQSATSVFDLLDLHDIMYDSLTYPRTSSVQQLDHSSISLKARTIYVQNSILRKIISKSSKSSNNLPTLWYYTL